ncbi:MAG: glycosyltransferase [Myxococcales bacterium]|nr:glycosyltransferase [Myxococcales bacterium]MCB9737039.1 glycosyltransferase [Deltaproteobacteria bacterium]
MTPSPAVTVALPVHDAAATVGATIASVVAQSFRDWELAVVCNGCSDGTVAIARAAAARDPRVRVDVQPVASVVLASNRALEMARAPLHARIDADDLMPPGRLAAQVAALSARAEWAGCTGRVVHDGAAGGMARHVAWLNGLAGPRDIHDQRFVDSPIANPAAMVRTAALRAVGGWRDGDFAEDYDLWLRLLARGARIGRADGDALVWRDLPTRLTRTDPRYGADAMRRLKHRHLWEGPLRRGARACRIWGSGPYGKRHARGLLALGARVDAFIDIDPRKIGGRAAGGVAVVAPEALGPPDGRLTLVAVATPGARAEVMARLAALGHEPGRDVLPVQ